MATATNSNNLDFAAGSVGDDATHVHLYTASSGGDLLWAISLTGNPAALTANQFYRVEAGDLTFTQNTGTGESEDSAVRALRGRFEPTAYLAAADGMSVSDELTPPARIQVGTADFTYAT